jgi:DNA repair protein RadC
MLIREMPESERPAARLRLHGAGALSNAELLTVVLGAATFTPAQAALLLSRGSLRELSRKLPAEIMGAAEIGPAVALRLSAALEIGRRMMGEGLAEGAAVNRPRDIYEMMRGLEDCPVEEFHVIALNGQNRVTRGATLLSVGILNASLAHPREVFARAIAERAKAIIVVHNHPSGDPTPSPDDLRVTSGLVAAGQMLDIPVQDHVIIGRGRYVSFSEAGLL